ncbi:hypothetical protein FB440_111103 [Vibrio crassostreae]|uniref:hypothetical protein n=1 Tax=Vibrio TaxID=662 RepID=UPI00031941BF|nr:MULTISPECIES: hypothetical protein [Vibrio]OEE80865.1 hypothetical protein OAI_12915 [Vibrio cyclitrophicus FF160]PMJ22264.1 hypothetical protein BCU28_07295 [Vibrio cyclitrophicus]TWD36210.1 hypothetical protein FB440_111103 [Vibrio crassostreae]
MTLEVKKSTPDPSWGCEYDELFSQIDMGKVQVCLVRVSDLRKVAMELITKVQDTSWMTNLDPGAKRSYDRTVADTAEALVEVFNDTLATSTVGKEFGEIMVSIGSTKALEVIFDHNVLPISELWKPQVKQNEGFDFHTVCSNELINFGEAKFSSKKSPHGNAIDQAKGFIENEKHLRDRVHLRDLVSANAIHNLDDDSYGVVASFSINAGNPLLVLKNAIDSATQSLSSEKIKSVYLVGVTH